MSEKILLGLQIGRGIAAIAVVLFHAEGAFNNIFGIATHNIFSFGYAGVHFFFVISGFIIIRSHRLDINRPELFRVFWLRRVFRILPLFWLVMIAYGAKSLLANQWDMDYFLKSFFLLPMPGLPLLVQSWTLTHEFIFYGVFSLLIVLGPKARYIFPIWFVLIIIIWIQRSSATCDSNASCILNAIYNPINLLFGFGMLAEYICRTLNKIVSKAIFWVGILYFAILISLDVFGVLDKGSKLDVFGYGSASFLVLCGLPHLNVNPNFSKVASWLGNTSYSAYLVHGMIISVVISVVRKWIPNENLLYFLGMIIIVVVTLIASTLIFSLFERPLARLLAPMTRRIPKTVASNERNLQ